MENLRPRGHVFVVNVIGVIIFPSLAALRFSVLPAWKFLKVVSQVLNLSTLLREKVVRKVIKLPNNNMCTPCTNFLSIGLLYNV